MQTSGAQEYSRTGTSGTEEPPPFVAPLSQLRALLQQQITDQKTDLRTIIGAIKKFADQKKVPTTEYLLPFLLRLKGNPYSLKKHKQFAPLFRTRRPNKVLYKCGRQVGKSVTFAADGLILSAQIPNFGTLYVTPIYEQIRRFSTLVVRPFLQDSPLRNLWVGSHTENSVLQRSFVNGSRMMFSFATDGADRSRGLSVNRVSVDEVQDLEDFRVAEAVLAETMAADEDYEMSQYAGTPKTLDNAIEAELWEKSSQAEWWIPCHNPSCMAANGGKIRWNIPSCDYHLDAMLGDLRMDISFDKPGLVCYHCKQPVLPHDTLSHWRHRYPARRWLFAGYHIPQPILPLHYGNIKKWATLLMKRETRPRAVFMNEVLGESADAGQKLITKSEIKRACRLPWENNPMNPSPDLMARLDDYKLRVLAVDWGGGGLTGFSYTAFAVLGLRHDNKIDVLWGRRLPGTDHIGEATEALLAMVRFRCHIFAHDFGGAGIVREAIIVKAGLPPGRLFPVSYVATGRQKFIKASPPTEDRPRPIWTVDKTYSLLMTTHAIKTGYTRLFQYDGGREIRGLLDDFTNMIESRAEIEYLGSAYRVIPTGTGSDDFAQAVNIGNCAIWQTQDIFPDFAAELAIKFDASLFPNQMPDWDEFLHEDEFRHQHNRYLQEGQLDWDTSGGDF